MYPTTPLGPGHCWSRPALATLKVLSVVLSMGDYHSAMLWRTPACAEDFVTGRWWTWMRSGSWHGAAFLQTCGRYAGSCYWATCPQTESAGAAPFLLLDRPASFKRNTAFPPETTSCKSTEAMHVFACPLSSIPLGYQRCRTHVASSSFAVPQTTSSGHVQGTNSGEEEEGV